MDEDRILEVLARGATLVRYQRTEEEDNALFVLHTSPHLIPLGTRCDVGSDYDFKADNT